MTTSDVHVPAFDPTTTSVTTRATAPGSYYHPCFQPSMTTTTTTTTTTTVTHPHTTTTTFALNSTTDPSLYSLTHGSYQYPLHLLQQQQQSQPLPPLPLQQLPPPQQPPFALSSMPSDLSSVSSSSTSSSSSSNTSFSVASAATNSTTVTPEDDEKPCEKYRQFLHSTRQERTVVIDKLVGECKKITMVMTRLVINISLFIRRVCRDY